MGASLQAGSTVASRYRLERQIARGGMGSVWLATHLQLDAPVAIKFMTTNLEASLIARFEREAKACARLNSPYIVKVSDFGISEGGPFMVMELLTGEDLGARLKREGAVPFDRLAVMADQIGRGLSIAHDAGIVHRDLKPANVFLARAGREEIVKLLDFGVAREMEQRMVDDLTTSGLILGSPHHMSPEQAAGEGVDRRCDLWSFGILLYQALTGTRPFDGPNLTSILLAITSRTAAPPSTIVSGVPVGTDAFFERALRRDKRDRFQTAEEMAAAFEALSENATTKGMVAVPLSGRVMSGSSEGVTPLATADFAPQAVAPSEPANVSTSSRIMRGVERGVKAPSTGGRAPYLLVPIGIALAGVGFWSVTRTGGGAHAPVLGDMRVTTASAVALATSGPTVVVASAAPAAPAGSALLSVPASVTFSSTPKISSSSKPVKGSMRPAPTSQPKSNTGGCPSGKVPDAFTGLCVTKH